MKLVLGLLLFAGSAFASIPEGNFSGHVSTFPFNRGCDYDRVRLSIEATGEGNYELVWSERDNTNFVGCEWRVSAELTATGDNQWDVRTHGIRRATATLDGDTLTISGHLRGRGFARYSASFTFGQTDKQGRELVGYDRRVRRTGQNDRRVRGKLRRR